MTLPADLLIVAMIVVWTLGLSLGAGVVGLTLTLLYSVLRDAIRKGERA